MTDDRRGPASDSPPAAVRHLLRWYQPYLAGRRRLMTGIILGTLVVIACQALVPWLVEVILHHGEWDSLLLTVLVALVAVQLGVGYATHSGVHMAANAGGLALRQRLFERLLRSRVLRQEGVQRSGVVLRVTQDVDAVSAAYETTLAFGIPGLARLIVSLALLTVIDWRAGLTMTVVSLAFLILRRRIGPSLMVADEHRFDAQGAVGETVDETITNAQLITGLRLGAWQAGRFRQRAEQLEHAAHRQGTILNRLILAAHTTALVGLVAVVVFALAFSDGAEDLAAVAAALLYVEGAVRGLEALPPWIRDVQRAEVAQRSISRVLDEPDVAPPAAPVAPVLPSDGLVGLVTGPGVDGVDVLTRLVHSTDDALLVPAQAETLDASPADLIKAVAPDVDHAGIERSLAAVGLDDLVSTPGALDRPLGSHGQSLTVDERQRLLTAVALAARPATLMLGPLLALGDVDTALTFVAAVRAQRDDVTVLAAQSAEVAEAVDRILFADGGDLRLGTHQQLLVEVPAYASLWEQRLSPMDVDLSVIGIEPGAEDRLKARLVTEHYSPGDLLYRQGAPADRILFIISGHVEITTSSADGGSNRVAVLGPGNHCGDLRLTVGERRAESASALDDCVVRSLSRQAITAGLTGLLDRTPAERQIVETLLRSGPGTRTDLLARLPGMEPTTFATSLALLMQDGAARDNDGVISAVLQRTGRTGSRHILDRLGDL